jgi:hypothetical protein
MYSNLGDKIIFRDLETYSFDHLGADSGDEALDTF